jgi:DNA-binding MarR family transcriptional regulator
MDSPSAALDVFESLLITAHRVAVEVTSELGFEHLSAIGLVAVRMIARQRGTMTARTLASALGCSRPSATELVKRLVRDGFIAQLVDPTDERRRLLDLAEYGVETVEGLESSIDDRMRSVLRHFADDDMTRLRSLLERVDQGASYHRADRLWGLFELKYPAGRRRSPRIHLR